MDQDIQYSPGKKPYAQPGVTSQELTLGVYGNYSGGGAVIGYNDPSGGSHSGTGTQINGAP